MSARTEVMPLERGGAAAARAALERTITGGGVAVFPSDGVYGLACDPLDAVGAIAVEIGEGQAVEVAELMRDAGFAEVEVREDLAGIERVVIGER